MSATKLTVLVPAVTFALLGAFLSAILLAQQGLADSREAVLFSRWATFPPPLSDAAPTSGVPVALIGLVYFLAMATWLTVVGQLGWTQRLWHSLPMASALLAGLVSVALTTLMVRQETWCPVCLAVHALNLALAAYIYLCRPVRSSGDVADSPAEPRPVALGLALAACMTAVAWFGWENFQYRQQNRALSTALARTDTRATATSSDAPIAATPASAEAPASPAGWVLNSSMPDAATVVVFTDLSSLPCRDFGRRLLEDIAPQFGGRLRVAFRHFPQGAPCNPAAANDRPQACEAAYLAEAGRQQGGAVAFLRVMQAIEPDRSTPWSDEDAIRLSLDLGLNPQKFVEDWQGSAVRRRVAEDVGLARGLGVAEVPTVYVNGQKLDPRLRDQAEYWQQLAGRVSTDGRPADGTVTTSRPTPAAASVTDDRSADARQVTTTAPPDGPSATDRPDSATQNIPNTFETTPAPVLAQGLIQRYDLNGDGTLQPAEYAKVSGDFAKYDTNSDGDVTVGELSAAIAIAQRLKKTAPPKPAP